MEYSLYSRKFNSATQARVLFSVLLMLVSLSNPLLAQHDNFIKNHYSVSDGLSQNEVTSICEDRYGFMWFGTRGGLNRYDGYEFKRFKPSRNGETSIQNPSVERLYIDHEGKIWIGTKSGGLSIYDPTCETFTHGDSFLESKQDRVVSFLEDMDGSFWFGSFGSGLQHYSNLNSKTENALGNSNAGSIIQTQDSTLWIGTNAGLVYKKRRGEFTNFSIIDGFYEITELVEDPDDPYLWLVGWNLELVRFNYLDFSFKTYSLPEFNNIPNNTYSILHDNEGNLWIGTWGGGLYRFNKKEETFNKIEINPEGYKGHTADYDIILDIFQDSEGAFWIGTDGGGVVRLSPSGRFNIIDSFDKNTNLHITSINSAPPNKLFVGSRGKGVFWSQNLISFEPVETIGETEISSSNSRSVYSISEVIEGKTWVGTDKGIYIIDQQLQSSPVLIRASDYFQSQDLIIPLKVLDILMQNNRLWIATQQRGLFLYKKNNNRYKLEHQFIASNSDGDLHNNRISELILDEEENLWIGTYNGLYRYRDTDSTFIPLKDLLSESKMPLCYIILCTYLDAENNIWFGTPCSLNKLSKVENDKYKLSEYTINQGLPDDYINNILQDNSQNLWVSSNAGISRFNLETEEFYNFEESDGIGGPNFSETSGFKSEDGTLYFGGYSSLTYFQPDQIADSSSIPPIAITNLKILNSEVPVSDGGILPVSINDLEELILTYKEKEVSIVFAALDYKSPVRNQYAYKLEKGNEIGAWVYIGRQRSISLRNLSPGEYVLHLRGSNSNGKWNEEGRILKIKVEKPPWKKWYALTFYIVLILSIFALIIVISLKQERLKNEARVEHNNRQQEKVLHEYKLRFFTNISHEFRTPLTLILAPINELFSSDLSGLNNSIVKKLKIISRNANRLMNLVTQLLEFRKIEVGKARIEAGQQDVILFIKDICQSFKELANHRNIVFKQNFKIKSQLLYFDHAKIDVVLNNLLSNAFKYCGKPGRVELQVSDTNSELVISLSNDGKGIPESELDNIFDRFYQITSERYYESSGIGLALVKNYIEMHKGNIKVFSQPDEETRFIITLLKGREHFTDDEIVSKTEHIERKEKFVIESENFNKSYKFQHVGTKGAKILIAEDNQGLQDYLFDLLSEYFEVYITSDGREGFEQALKINPDLVISDVMMPIMDGYEFCKKIKSHEILSGTPVILLTAKETASDKIFGTKSGADDYITKPFDPELLLEKIKQILASRKKLSDKYSKKITLEPTKQEITSEDEKLLNSALSYIEKNIANKDLNIDMLASELAMSPTTLYRQMKSICNQSPGDFIKSTRFKRASQLLRDTDLTISEIVESVGYYDTKRFRESFKLKFGLSPHDYRNQNKS